MAKRHAGSASALTADINLNRGSNDHLMTMGSAAERVHAEKDDRLIEQAQTIKNLQNHSKLPLFVI